MNVRVKPKDLRIETVGEECRVTPYSAYIAASH
jgi:hypothetical protein